MPKLQPRMPGGHAALIQHMLVQDAPSAAMAAAAIQQQEAALPDDPARTLQRRDSSHLPQVMADLLPVTVFGGKSLVICLLDV